MRMKRAAQVELVEVCVVREIGEHGVHLLLVKPGSVDQIALAVEQLYGDPALWRRLSANARTHVRTNYTWQRAGEALAVIYEDLGINRFSTV